MARPGRVAGSALDALRWTQPRPNRGPLGLTRLSPEQKVQAERQEANQRRLRLSACVRYILEHKTSKVPLDWSYLLLDSAEDLGHIIAEYHLEVPDDWRERVEAYRARQRRDAPQPRVKLPDGWQGRLQAALQAVFDFLEPFHLSGAAAVAVLRPLCRNWAKDWVYDRRDRAAEVRAASRGRHATLRAVCAPSGCCRTKPRRGSTS